MKIPFNDRTTMVVVSGQLDAADDWIVEHVKENDIVITADILLADRCLKKGARVLGTYGDEFTEDNIGDAVASREIMQMLRSMGENTQGQGALTKNHRSKFLGKLDQIIINILKKNESGKQK
jgi:uncharacterized protein YaiI (UPF0178 family)